jgi:ABC-type nitrate/sulfonate/bicarbonate transport system substrate-binding protein
MNPEPVLIMEADPSKPAEMWAFLNVLRRTLDLVNANPGATDAELRPVIDGFTAEARQIVARNDAVAAKRLSRREPLNPFS